MMTNDELQGVVPDPNPNVKCDDCGDSHPLEWWSERTRVPPPPEGFICPDCREVREREEANESITEWCA